ncbi:hypothetical protein PCH_Pc22g24490 [Penicillium rubens Wisconsin 54-1255]|uniref:Uncharacterized protein n=1 Tax=Penicillium rubens (strain ATCC 28089 / DSM 1075 / NRRL 1951 / Wisconsin 54-1255) TaxID=500485 RepID=B6HQV8_PENRW|nr:hypothetical protein PCH_Pc22g24490 [Penicillium rubens Wisconsin 54-1255]
MALPKTSHSLASPEPVQMQANGVKTHREAEKEIPILPENGTTRVWRRYTRLPVTEFPRSSPQNEFATGTLKAGLRYNSGRLIRIQSRSQDSVSYRYQTSSHPDQPGYVCRGGKHWAIITIKAQVGRGVLHIQPSTPNLTGTLVMVFLPSHSSASLTSHRISGRSSNADPGVSSCYIVNGQWTLISYIVQGRLLYMGMTEPLARCPSRGIKQLIGFSRRTNTQTGLLCEFPFKNRKDSGPIEPREQSRSWHVVHFFASLPQIFDASKNKIPYTEYSVLLLCDLQLAVDKSKGAPYIYTFISKKQEIHISYLQLCFCSTSRIDQ